MTDPHRPSAPVDYEQDLTRSPWVQESEGSPLVSVVVVVTAVIIGAFLAKLALTWWLG